MYYVIKAGQYVGLQHWTALMQSLLLGLGCLGRANVVYFLLLSVFNEFPSSLVFDRMYLYCRIVCSIYLSKQKKVREGFMFSCGILLHLADWLTDYLNDYFVSAIPLRNSIIRNPMLIQKSPKNLPKENISNYCGTVSRTLFVVFEVLHFRNNNPEWEPADETITLLICVREYWNSIYRKDDFIPVLKRS